MALAREDQIPVRVVAISLLLSSRPNTAVERTQVNGEEGRVVKRLVAADAQTLTSPQSRR